MKRRLRGRSLNGKEARGFFDEILTRSSYLERKKQVDIHPYYAYPF